MQLTIGGIALAVLGVGGAFSVDRVVRERDAALAAEATADEQRARADTERGAAEDLVGFVMKDLRPAVERVGQLSVMQGVAKQVDDFYQRVTSVDALDANAVARRSQALSTLGDYYQASHDEADAQRMYAAAIAALGQHADRPVELASAQLGIVEALVDTGKYDDAVAAIAKGLAALDRAPATTDATLARARFERQRGILLATKGDQQGAIASDSAAIDRLTAALHAEPKNHDLRFELTKSYDRRSDARDAIADRPGSLADAKASLAIREQLRDEGPFDFEVQDGLAISWSKIATEARVMNQLDDAKRANERATTITGHLVEIDPTNMRWLANLLAGYESAADLEYDQDHFEAAYALVEKPLETSRAAVERTDNLNVRDAYTNLLCKAADYENQIGKPDTLARALELGTRCLAISEALHASVPDDFAYYRGIGVAHDRIGDTHAQKNEWQQAADEYRQRVAVDEELLRRDPSNPRRKVDLASSQFNTGMAVSHLPGHGAEGVALLEAAYGSLTALRAAGQLSPDMEASLPEYEKQLAAAKLRR